MTYKSWCWFIRNGDGYRHHHRCKVEYIWFWYSSSRLWFMTVVLGWQLLDLGSDSINLWLLTCWGCFCCSKRWVCATSSVLTDNFIYCFYTNERLLCWYGDEYKPISFAIWVRATSWVRWIEPVVVEFVNLIFCLLALF